MDSAVEQLNHVNLEENILPERVYNFCPGPCTLPLEVLQETQSELGNYKDSGMSIIECSHRGELYDDVHNQVVNLTRELLQVPDEFTILLIQGGATLQFAMSAMNLATPEQKIGFVNSGHWAKLARNDGKIYTNTYNAWDGSADNFTRTPTSDEIELEPDTRYLHVTTNETIGGVRLREFPDVGVPLVGDMSSDYFSRRIPWHLMDAAYGGAQKNVGPSGVALVIVRKSAIEEKTRDLPSYLDYGRHHESNSLFNTPAVFAIYVASKVLKYYKDRGGVDEFAKIAKIKSGHVYDAIDSSDGFYDGPVTGESRSVMNVVFRLPNDDLENKFLEQAEEIGLVNLQGHRSVGGIRASIYNSMPMEGAETLANFMNDFRSANS